MSRAVAVTLAAPPPPSLQEAIKNSTEQWQQDLQSLFKNAKERFPDVVWELSNEEELEDEGFGGGFMGIGTGGGFDVSHVNGYGSSHGHGTADSKPEEVWGHKAIVYARAPPSFQSRYFRVGGFNASASGLPYSSDDYAASSDDHGHGLDDGDADASHQTNPQYPSQSAISLGVSLGGQDSIYRTSTPTSVLAPSQQAQAQSNLLRLQTSINSALFANELEYLYTGQGFGEAFEFLFDSNEHAGMIEGSNAAGTGTGTGGSSIRESASELSLDAQELRIDKLRKDLVFMWRSRLYSDIRIALTGNFSSGGGHENTTAIFSSHRFMLASRSPYFHTALLGAFNKSLVAGTANGDPPTLTLPSPPFTPPSLHFTLGFIYTGTLIFSHRTYDLSTAFGILKSAVYLGLTTLHDEIQARIAHEMCHGLFHAFLPFPAYESLTQGRWGVGGCRCRQCARRIPRVLGFALEEDVKNPHLERGARRALVGLFGEGWCTSEFAALNAKVRESLVKGVGKRTTVENVWSLLWASEVGLAKIGPVIEPYADTIRENILSARKTIDELICRESEACFGREEWVSVVEGDGMGFEDSDKVEWAMSAVLRGVKEAWAPGLYQTLVSSILLRPHPNEENAPLLSATSPIRTTVESTRLELLKWIGRRWIGIRQEGGFDDLEGWALKEISDHIEVPIEDLFNPHPTTTTTNNNNNKSGVGGHRTQSPHASPAKSKSSYPRPISQHPHTSRIDTDSDAASSMRVSLLTRNTGGTSSRQTSSTRRGGDGSSVSGSGASYLSSLGPSRRKQGAESVKSGVSSRSTATYESASTVGAARRRAERSSASVTSSVLSQSLVSAVSGGGGHGDNDEEDSPAKRIAASTRSRMKEAEKRERERERERERPDSKLTPPEVDLERVIREYEDELRSDIDQHTGQDADDGDADEGHDSDRAVDGDAGDDEDADSDSTAGTTARGAQVGGGKGKGKELAGGRGGSTVSRRTTTLSNASSTAPAIKKMLVTRASLASVTSRATTTGSARPRSSASSVRSVQTHSGGGAGPRKSGGSAVSSSSSVLTRPSSRGSVRTTATTATGQSRTTTTASSRSTLSTVSTASRSTLSSRPNSRLSTTSTNTAGASGARPVSAVSTISSSNSTDMTFRTASAGGSVTPTTPTAGLAPAEAIPRSRKTSAASTVSTTSVSTTKTTSSLAPGARTRKGSTGSVNSIAAGAAATRNRKTSTSSVASSSAASVRSPAMRKEKAPAVPPLDPTKLSAPVASKRSPLSPISPTVSKAKSVARSTANSDPGSVSRYPSQPGKAEHLPLPPLGSHPPLLLRRRRTDPALFWLVKPTIGSGTTGRGVAFGTLRFRIMAGTGLKNGTVLRAGDGSTQGALEVLYGGISHPRS